MAVTLEPCCHHGRTGPCTDALAAAGLARIVVALHDTDRRVAGRGLDRLRALRITVAEGVSAEAAAEQLRPYLHHRRTGRPFVVLTMAATVDGRAAAHGTSRWITGPAARAEVHRLRATSDAVLVGAGTVRADDPMLTVRDADGPDPQRVVLGEAPPATKVRPCWELAGPIDDVAAELGRRGVLQVLVEGGPGVARAFHEAGAVDRYVLHLAPALAGGDDSRPLFAGAAAGAATVSDFWRGRLVQVRRLGDDVEIVIEPSAERDASPTCRLRHRR